MKLLGKPRERNAMLKTIVTKQIKKSIDPPPSHAPTSDRKYNLFNDPHCHH
jgi:hypothetical protein